MFSILPKESKTIFSGESSIPFYCFQFFQFSQGNSIKVYFHSTHLIGCVERPRHVHMEIYRELETNRVRNKKAIFSKVCLFISLK